MLIIVLFVTFIPGIDMNNNVITSLNNVNLFYRYFLYIKLCALKNVYFLLSRMYFPAKHDKLTLYIRF